MFAEERQAQICALLEENHMVRVTDLTQKFQVSLETIRRDLCALECQGLLRRVHGGAMQVQERTSCFDFAARLQVQNSQKRSIAECALKQISQGDVIILDGGTTTLEMAKILPQYFQHLTIITNSVPILAALTESSSFQIVVPGGQLAISERTLYGDMALEQLKKFHADKAFLSPSGISLEAGFTDYHLDLIRLQQGYISISHRIIMLADSSKFETSALSRICGIDECSLIITDSNLEEELYKLYIQNNIPILKSSQEKQPENHRRENN